MTRTRTRRAVTVAGAVLVVPLLAGCGGKDYCQTVTASQSRLGSLANAPTGTGALQTLPILEKLESKAPGDIHDDYQLVVSRLQGLQAALSRAGVDPSSYDASRPPAGLSATDRRRIRDAAALLATSDTHQALAAIQQEVLDVCHTPLEL